ncbi:MAG TPA: TIM barrel protein [Terriglobales bacterium]|nr:TIM barrel protein [Terriglobales bacterium]
MERSHLSRRSFVKSSALVAAASVLPGRVLAQDGTSNSSTAIRLGLASYTFRNFSRAQLIAFMKQLNINALNAKDVKDHLPFDLEAEKAALADYAAAGIKLHGAGVVYFGEDNDEDVRAKFEYCKRAGVPVIVAGVKREILPRIEKFVKEYDLRFAIHNHGPEDNLWPSPLDVLNAIKTMDSRIGCCIDVGHAARAGTDVVQAIREIGPRLFNVHIKDLTDFSQKESQVAVGQGKLPIKKSSRR